MKKEILKTAREKFGEAFIDALQKERNQSPHYQIRKLVVSIRLCDQSVIYNTITM